ncbi:hypothetical protein HY041_00845 [Candidatus Roizmanbacteria bacterium]|nr:hypothetical protein [Candidatus Roizmanbacteria bacterium]
MATLVRIENPNIGALGEAEFQAPNGRVKGFCPRVVSDPNDYLDYLNGQVLPLAESSNASRIIDRAVIANGIDFTSDLSPLGLSIEAAVPLGGRWKNYTWIMVGGNKPGRILSEGTSNAIKELVKQAQRLPYEPVKSLPDGYVLDCIKGRELGEEDLRSLIEIFGAAFSAYLTPMTDPNFLVKWVKDESTMPFVIRNENGLIVAVANADLAEMNFDNTPQSFRFVEIGDSATHPDSRGGGFNRVIKAKIISTMKELGYDSVHTESRASWGAPNFANAKNGMEYYGTLWSNCMIKGPEDIPESDDSQLASWARDYGSLNVWAMTPANQHWNKF